MRVMSLLAAAGILSAAVFACTDGTSPAADDGVVPDASSPAAAEAGGPSPLDGASATEAPDGSVAPTDASVDASVDSSPGDADAEPEPAPPGVRYVGRFDTSDPAGPRVAWPGARVVVRFAGTEARATLGEQVGFTGPSRYDVLVDGAFTKTVAPADGISDVVLADGLAAGTHVVELHRRTESFVGITQFRGFTFPNGGQLLAPPKAPARRLEFLGDSASNGYGVECANPNLGYSGATQNERKAFPALAALALGADHHDLGFAGKGLLRNYDADDDQVFGLLYPRTMPETVGSAWDFSTYHPDVVWITLGGNDYDNAGNRPAPNLAAFETKYTELVTRVRTEHPLAQIVLAVAPSLTDDYPVGYAALTSVTTAVNDVRNARVAAGDPKVHVHVFTRADADVDLTGCEYHSNAAFHAKLALEVVAKVKAITGWP